MRRPALSLSRTIDEKPVGDRETMPLLEARKLRATRATESGMRVVLDGVDLAVETGTLTDVVGPSGAGKTTLLLALARLLPCAEVTLSLEGVPAESIDPARWRRDVALLPQVPALVPGTVADNLLLPWRLKVRAEQQPPALAALEAALTSVGLGDVSPMRDVARLSVGQQARVALLRVLLARPAVLLLDEPTAALDDESAARVTEAVLTYVREGGGAIRVRHLRSDELATRRYRMEAGRLLEAAPAPGGGA
jgi:putative ABC transport system ATP-binding protein